MSLYGRTRSAISELRLESRCFLAIGLFFGFLAIVFVPPIITFDGPSHFFRAVEISRGSFRAVRYSERRLGGPIPGRYSRFVHTVRSSYWPGHQLLTLSEWSAITRIKPGDNKNKIEEWTNTAIYSPANYLPQSLGMAVSRVVSRSPLWAHRAACTLNLVLFLALITWALEAIPRARTTLLVFALSPFVFIQAASVNIDGINFAVPVCLFALVGKMRSDPRADTKLALVEVTSLALWIALLKPPNIVCLGFLCFVPVGCFRSPYRKAGWLAATLVTAAALCMLWNGQYADVNVTGWLNLSHPPIRNQRAWLVQHPGDFLLSFKAFFHLAFPIEWEAFFGGVGRWIPDWASAWLNHLSYWFLPVLLLLPVQGRLRDRAWGAITFAHAAALLFVMSLVLWIAAGIKYTGYIPFLGGRYLFLVFLLSFVAWSEMIGLRSRILGRVLLVVGLTLDVVGLGLILIPTVLAVAG